MIRCLSKEVQSKLRSGIAISSLQQCVEELILNSIDAGATCVGVRIDMKAFKVQVIDNGSGMGVDDLQRVGNRYFTSKCSSVEDLERLKFYGFRGEAVASIVSVATLVEISSRTKLSVKTHAKVFKNGKGMDVFEAETVRPAAGTTFTIFNFFHNMPVRRNRIDPVLEAERIRHRVEAISLMHPSVSFTLKNDVTGAMLAQLSKARTTYQRFVQIHGLGRAQHLREISHTEAQFKVSGYLGIEGHYNKSLQLLYVNERLLLKTRLHKLLNFLLRKLSSSCQKNDSPEGQSSIRSPKHKRGQELHAIYVINIKCCYSEYDICLEPAKTLIEFKDWDGILECIEETVKAFLSRENLVADISQPDLDHTPQSLLCTTEPEGKSNQVMAGEASLEYVVGRTLASKPVHRKRVVDCLLEKNVAQTCVQNKTTSKEGTEEKLALTGDTNVTETKQNNGLTSKESGDGLEPLSKENGINENIPHIYHDGYLFNSIECMPSTVDDFLTEQMDEKGEEGVRSNDTATSGKLTARHSITQEGLESMSTNQMVRHQQSSNIHCQTPEGIRKIRLLDPYIHESLQAFCQPVSTKRCQENTGLSKRKISTVQISDHVQSNQKVSKDISHDAPSKVPKIAFCQKLLSNESASLDRFRRIYGKHSEEKIPSIAAASINKMDHAQLPQIDDLAAPGQVISIAQKKTQIGESIIMQDDCQSPPTFSMFTKLKPISDENGSSGVSLATKLCHLKRQKAEVLQSPNTHPSETASREIGIEAIRDSSNSGPSDPDPQSPESSLRCNSSPVLVAEEEVNASGDWLNHYDHSVGKTVYVNKVTGLSRYEDPALEETQVCCMSDISSMAVNVVSESGFEYRCYPFQMGVVLPFLPKAKEKRVVSSSANYGGDKLENLNSLSSLHSKWNNPVFVRPPVMGLDISSKQADGLAVKIHNILFSYRFSKAMIHSMKVIHQVDKKFLACLINTRDQDSAKDLTTEGNLLVLVDQHAAHERVRLERLIADSYEDDPDTPEERRLCSSTIVPPLEISVTEEELRLLRSCQSHLRGLGLQLEFLQTGAPWVLVGKVPLCFTEKEHNELKRGRPSVIKPLVEEYLREQIELFCSTGRVKRALPLTVLKVLASLACHGAIKFNDVLSRDECHSLVGSLSTCQLPFQCAHGRPSIAPLVDTLYLDSDKKESLRPNLQRLRRMYKAWELYGNR